MKARNVMEVPGPDDPIPPMMIVPGPEDEVTDRYEFFDASEFEGAVPMRVVHCPRHPLKTGAQALVTRRETERHYHMLSVMRNIAQDAANWLGYPARCAHRRCRRARACRTFRDEFDWAFPGPWMPPCASTPRQVDEVRSLIVEEARKRLAALPDGG